MELRQPLGFRKCWVRVRSPKEPDSGRVDMQDSMEVTAGGIARYGEEHSSKCLVV
jgi:hypothetical protein